MSGTLLGGWGGGNAVKGEWGLSPLLFCTIFQRSGLMSNSHNLYLTWGTLESAGLLIVKCRLMKMRKSVFLSSIQGGTNAKIEKH